MARLIDADALLEGHCYVCSQRQREMCKVDPVCGSAMWIMEAPTVDAVEVVRCKDCTQWGGVAFGNVCKRWSAPLAGMKNCTGEDDFCSYGERRNDG